MACRRIICNLKPQIASKDVRFMASFLGTVFPGDSEAVKKEELAKKTHTGQIFDGDDYRNVRFTNASRKVNPNWAIDLIAEVPPKECTERVVACDGGDSHLGHPKVYINLDKPGAHACGYCGLRFIKKDEHH